MKISICIPAFKRVDYLARLLNSIAKQTYKDFEVIITDDSNDDSVADLIQQYRSVISNLFYFKNENVKGTPENWNEAIRKANSDWIKIMHDDDWFNSEDSMKVFADSIRSNPDADFIFCAYNNVLEGNKRENIRLSVINNYLLKKSPFYLFKEQFIGNPSCTLIRKDPSIRYDIRLKWVVDFDYYIRYFLKHKTYFYIYEPLVNVGLNEDQVTKYTFRNPEVELPENHLLIEKYGTQILRNIFVYDYYWRLYRNLNIRSINDVKKYYSGRIPNALKSIISFQSHISGGILHIGVFSKLFMALSYLINDRKE